MKTTKPVNNTISTKEEEINKIKNYYGCIKLDVVIKSLLKEADFMSMFDAESGIKARLVLETYDGKVNEIDILNIITKWFKSDEY